MMICPVCHKTSFEPFAPYPAYSVCTHCNLHLQETPPPKVFEGPQENFGMGPGTGHLMSDHDKAVTKDLAENLYLMFRPGHVLDIGTKYPYLLSILNDRANVLGIDGIEQVLTYGEELGVPTVQADIESMEISGLKGTFDLITLIHVLEHFYDPEKTMEKILSLLSDRGTLFIRTPDPLVPGIQRDLTEHHLKIHPFLFTRKALDLLLDRFGYEIFRHDSFPGYGQSDYYIRKNLRGRTDISLCMIVKNEEKNITDCLESIKGHVDEIVIVDTGSEDATKDVVGKYTDKIYDFKWIDDFSAARNFALSKCTKPWALWADADDQFQNPELIKPALSRGFDAFNFNIIYGNDVFCHARLFRNFSGVHFKGRVHEYPVLHWLPFQQATELNVIHKTEKYTSENRILRNVRILKKEYEAEPNNARCLFYLANAYRELGTYDQALENYEKYLALSTWKDERYLAQKYMGQIHMWQKRYDQARTAFLQSIATDDRWAESYYHIGETYFSENRPEMCIHWMNIAVALPVPDSPMFKDMAVYRDLPYRYLAACYEGKGDRIKAAEVCEKALEKTPNDAWLQNQLQRFRNRTERPVIECYRQGALGDCLMTTAALRGLKEGNPGCFIRYVTHPSSMPILEGNKYIDELTSNPENDVSQRVYFAYPNSESQHDEGYPDKPLTRNLVQIFNECAGLPDNRLDLECTLSSADLKPSEMFKTDFGNYVTIHIQAGWSPYKEWYDDRWEAVVEHVLGLGFQVVQLGAEGDRPLKNTRPIRGIPIKQAIGFIKNAVFHLGVDSFSNHAAFAVGTRAVILFGSTSPVGSGHPTAINIWKKLPCSPCYREYEWARDPKSPCPYRKRCMDEITVDEVSDAVLDETENAILSRKIKRSQHQ